MQEKLLEFTIGTNFDKDIVHEITKVNKKADKTGIFTSVFGKLHKDILGGGRASMLLPKISINQLGEYIDLCHKNNLKFNYLANAVCLSNKELIPKYKKKILLFVDGLIKKGIDAITVVSPYLCELFKKKYPDLTVTVGLNARINKLQQLRYWENMGANEVTLYHDVNRNFPYLKNILKYTKKTGTKIRLIANNICMHECPYHLTHAIMSSHASQNNDKSSFFNVDYSILKCITTKVENITKLISSEWIRPEDLKYYLFLCKETDNYNLSIKYVERTKTSTFLKRVINAYSSGHYKGNLLDLLNWVDIKENKTINKIPMYLNIIKSLYNINELLQMEKFYNTIPYLYIDNSKLNGYIDKFIENFSCNENICNDLEHPDEKNKIQSNCSYCKSWAHKVISFDAKERKKWLETAKVFIDRLKRSKIFYFFNKKEKQYRYN